MAAVGDGTTDDIPLRFVEAERERLQALGGDVLYPAIRSSVLPYFAANGIAWWGGAATPTEHPHSSQLACLNHLEPARHDPCIALSIAKNILSESTEVLRLDGGYVEFEWIGKRNYLGERGWSPECRGKLVTSLDAIMAVRTSTGSIALLGLEWKYTESYMTDVSLAVSAKGTQRVDTYRAHLDHPDSPIHFGDHSRLFYDPFYQLMRQTLLLWLMAEHHEHGAQDWRHVHVIPEGNRVLRMAVTSPGLRPARDMATAWRSALKCPERYRVMTPTDLLAGSVGDQQWREWLHRRYGT